MGREELRHGIGRQHARDQDGRATRALGIGRLRQHDPQDGRQDERLATRVEGDGLIPGIAGQGMDRAVSETPAAAPGHGQQRIDPAEGRLAGGDRGVGLSLVAQVGDGVCGLGPGRPQSVDQFGAVGLGLRRHEDPGALGSEQLRCGRRDAGRAGDQTGLAVEAVHRVYWPVGRSSQYAASLRMASAICSGLTMNQSSRWWL